MTYYYVSSYTVICNRCTYFIYLFLSTNMHEVTLNLIDCEEIMVLNTVCKMYYQECHVC
jgi:hypothetical protein